MGDDYSYENRWGNPSRFARAASAIPGSFKHYDDLSSSIYENQKYSSSSRSSSSKRATSEVRDFVRESSVPAEISSGGHSYYNKRSNLADINELTSVDYLKDLGRDNSDLFELGTYKVTINPSPSSWISPSRFFYSPHSATTAALLEAYNPGKYPDFVFGRFGLNSSGNWTGRPFSATQRFIETAPARYPSRFYDVGSPFGSGLEREIPIRREGTPSSLGDYYYSRPNVAGRPRSSVTPSYNSGLGSRYSPYEPSYSIPPPKVDRFSKFYHYYIPKHYGGTPMLGGYLMPGHKWRY